MVETQGDVSSILDFKCHQYEFTLKLSATTQPDISFCQVSLVDKSIDMKPKQAKLLGNFPQFKTSNNQTSRTNAGPSCSMLYHEPLTIRLNGNDFLTSHSCFIAVVLVTVSEYYFIEYQVVLVFVFITYLRACSNTWWV